MRDALLCGVLALFLPRTRGAAVRTGRILVFFLIIVPTVVIPTFLSDEWDSKVIESKAYGVVAFLVLTAVLAALPRDAVQRLRLPGDLSLYILLALAVVAVLVLGSSYRFSIEMHPLSDVYDQREIYSEGGGGSGIIGFTAGLLQNVLAPIFLVVGMRRRSLLYFGVGANALALHIQHHRPEVRAYRIRIRGQRLRACAPSEGSRVHQGLVGSGHRVRVGSVAGGVGPGPIDCE